MSHIPSWVYILFLILLYIGIKGCFKRVMKIKLLILLPAGFVWLSINHLSSTTNITQMVFLLIGGVIGIYLGYLHARKTKVRADKQQNLVELPGDWTILILMVIIFAVQFGIHYLLYVDPGLSNSSVSMWSLMIVSGATTGVVVGRNLTYFFKYHKASHTHLAIEKSSFFK